MRTPLTAEVPSTSTIMVLLVDDQAMVGELVRRMIAPEPDLDLHYCPDPILALEQAAAIRPMVILQDLVMPNADGLDVVRRFRAKPETAHTPIIVLSSKEDAQVKSEAFAVGANDYLVKLPDRVEMIARLRYHASAHLAHLQRDEAMRALRESQQQLLRSNTALTEMNERLNEFVGMAAHDLRNPLTVLLGFSKYLMRASEATIPEQQRRMLASIQTSSEFMLRLVNNLLDVSKIEAGELHLEKAPTDLAGLVRQNVSLNQLLAQDKGIEIVLVIESDLPTLKIDPDKIEQVLNNLISNAVKFSHPGSTVTVTLRQVEGDALLSVHDQGPGIPEGEIDKLFKAFGRTSVRATAGEKSTGLGLVIAKQVVDRHGGRIWVETEVGKGTTFFVALPIEEPT